MLRSILSKRSLWVISGLVALHTRLLPIWSILGRKLRMLTVAFPSLEALKNHKKRVINNNWLYYYNLCLSWKLYFFSILAIFGQFLDYSCQYGPFWVENLGCSLWRSRRSKPFLRGANWMNRLSTTYLSTSLGKDLWLQMDGIAANRPGLL